MNPNQKALLGCMLWPLIVVVAIALVLFGLGKAFGAEPQFLDRITPFVNAGITTQIGHPYASDGWVPFFHNTTRKNPSVPTVRECADKFGGVCLHCPGGIFDVQNFDPKRPEYETQYAQRSKSTRLALQFIADPKPTAINPVEAVKNRVNWMEFVAAAKRFDHPLTIYVGAPHRFPRIGNESQASWLDRALDEIEPFLLAADTIGLDNTMGSHPSYDKFFHGKNGVVADLIKAIEKRGIKVVIEPCNYVSDTWLDDKPKIIEEWFLRGMMDLNVGKTNWSNRVGKIDNGILVDHEPIAPPGSHGEPWSIIASTQYGWDDAKTEAHILKLAADYPEAGILVYYSHIPLGWLDK